MKNASKIFFNDPEWCKLNLPNNHAIEGSFKPEYNLRTSGFLLFDKAWNRKYFIVKANKKGQFITLEFDAIISNSKIFINGKEIYRSVKTGF